MNALLRLCSVVTTVGVLLGGCSTAPPRNPVPLELEEKAEISGLPQARFWADNVPPYLKNRVLASTKAELQTSFPGLFGQPHNYLAISGGGLDGAFGAGLLSGWTESGDRPVFQLVTGVSTGALIAPFAFLGPAYDEVLQEMYTTTSTKDILRRRPLLEIFFAQGAVDPSPLKALIERYVNDEVIDAIAAEHRGGRRLFIGTTDADYMRPRIWNIGLIAASDEPGAKELVHKILLASASIPAAFPPVRIGVEVDGQSYDELHIDGGTVNQVFVYPADLDWGEALKRLQVPGRPNIYIIRNAKLQQHREIVEPEILPIARRSISSLIRTQGIGDLYLIYMLAYRDGANFRLAYVPDEFDAIANEPFDQTYMQALFDLGFDTASAGYQWHRTPPGWAHALRMAE